MEEKIITLRPHHVDRFVTYYHKKFNNSPNNILVAIKAIYGGDFTDKLQTLYDFVSSGGTGKEWILVRSGLDSICEMCPIKRETCSDPDSLSRWDGSGYVMEEMNLELGMIYSINEFMQKVKQLVQKESSQVYLT